jgi:hypothetical protein
MFVALKASIWRDCRSGILMGRRCEGGAFSEAVFSALEARLTFFCFAKRKVSKEKATLGRRRASPGSLRYSTLAGAAELGPAGLKQSSPFIRQRLRYSAPPKGPGKTSVARLGNFKFVHFFGPTVAFWTTARARTPFGSP